VGTILDNSNLHLGIRHCKLHTISNVLLVSWKQACSVCLDLRKTLSVLLPMPGDDDPDWFSSSSTADGLVLQPRHSPPHRVPGPLYLVALGNGGIKPCVSTLGADQFDAADPVERVTKGSFFSWYYFSVNIGSLLSATPVVWVQDNIGWGVGFAIPTALMLSCLAVFVAGRKVYRYQKVGGSPLTTVSQVVVAAVRNYHLELPEDCSALHEVPSTTEGNCRIQHTSQFR